MLCARSVYAKFVFGYIMYFYFSCMKLRKHGREPLFGHGNTTEWGIPQNNTMPNMRRWNKFRRSISFVIVILFASIPTPPATWHKDNCCPHLLSLCPSSLYVTDKVRCGKLYSNKSRLHAAKVPGRNLLNLFGREPAVVNPILAIRTKRSETHEEGRLILQG